MIIFILVAFASIGLECFGQVSPTKEVIYGTVRTDGYRQLTKGAFWKTRPEAKQIYEGANPEGYTVIVLDEDYFVRFANNEHNNLDRNYIVFPTGAIVYTDRTALYYSAFCGNKIEYIRPVNMVEVRERVVEKVEKEDAFSKPLLLDDTKYQKPIDLGLAPVTTTKKTKSWLGRNWPWVVAAVLVSSAGVVYGLTLKGKPGGAPLSPDVIPAGGPGGAPLTH